MNDVSLESFGLNRQPLSLSPRMSESNDMSENNAVHSANEQFTTDKRFELKYLLSPEQAYDIQQWAQVNLLCDEHCSGESGDSYLVKTLYLDSPDLDLFFGTGIAGRSKHRLRTYENCESVWIESKRKKGDLVRKKRSKIDNYSDHVFSSETEIGRFTNVEWFANRVVQRQLMPVVALSYRRIAYRDNNSANNARLTIDVDLKAQKSSNYSDWRTINPLTATCLNIQPILEFKFDGMMPFIFRQLLQTFSLQATAVSKYRTAVNTLLAERLNTMTSSGQGMVRNIADVPPVEQLKYPSEQSKYA